ncbi:MAG TPA: multidrug resistance efflux transporter family protein [Pseudomonadales bacterium]|nr:multidrug resistance efflux transporter family protein [Pseudomonadales bacterium]
MLRTLLYGILAALFFSTTFLLNRIISQEGGHWLWSAVLRYSYVLIFLLIGMTLSGHAALVRAAFSIYRQHWLFWTVTGSIGMGIFYSTICFSAAYAPSWVIAATWQSTILITPLVLMCFGRTVPLKGYAFALLVFLGVILINFEHASETSLNQALLGAIPAFISACAYPVGNQLVWEARKGERFKNWIPHIKNPELENSFCKILVLTLGSIPFWVILTLMTAPPPPTHSQLYHTALIALNSGIIAYALFLLARHRARNSFEITAVDATQAFEAVFTLIGEIVLLHAAIPSLISFIGIGLIILGVFSYSLFQATHSQ